MSTYYSFTIDRNKSTAAEAFRAVSRIYGAGLMIMDGQIIPGGNNVMADCAARAFGLDDLRELAGGSMSEALAGLVIELRQEYASHSASRDARRGQPDTAKSEVEAQRQEALLREIYSLTQVMKSLGWVPEMEPTRCRGPRPV